MVWHHRRNRLASYWRQQCGYGAAEAMLEKKWPEKYNTPGHVTWTGRVYCPSFSHWLGRVGRIYHGVWGSAPFQRLYQPSISGLLSLPMLPEWQLVVLLLTLLVGIGLLWSPMLVAAPLLILALAVLVIPATLSARRARFTGQSRRSRWNRTKLRCLTATLHVLQPLARLWGRLRLGLSPWRRRGRARFVFPRAGTLRLWTDDWQPPEERLTGVHASLRTAHNKILVGGEFDSWDIEVREGLLGAARLALATEDHAGGHQLVRVRFWPRPRPTTAACAIGFAILASWAAADRAWAGAAILGIVAMLCGARIVHECGRAVSAILNAVRESQPEAGR
jgi:membrane protein implicated in regulation of membrane protease activity